MGNYLYIYILIQKMSFHVLQDHQLGEQHREKGQKKTLFMQKLTAVPSSCYNLREHWLITVQTGRNAGGLQKHHRPRSRPCTEQYCMTQREEGKSLMPFTFTLLPSDPSAEIPSTGGVVGAEPSTVQRLLSDGETPIWSFCQPPHNWQIRQQEKEKKIHSRQPGPHFIPHNWVFS